MPWPRLAVPGYWEEGLPPSDPGPAANPEHESDKELIRSPAVTGKVSLFAKIPELREHMVHLQRELKSLGPIVLEGRDIGTIIFPDASHKFFITATPEERARRRLQQKGEVSDLATLESLMDEIKTRDRIDSTRSVAPLIPAPDATLIDTSDLSIDEVVSRMVTIFKKNVPILNPR